MDLLNFYDLVRSAEKQGLTVLFTDGDVCNTIVDMWPGEREELVDDEAPVVLFDTHYSDKIGPSEVNELLDMGPIDDCKCAGITAVLLDGKVTSVEIDKGPGRGKACITFLKSGLAGVEPPGYTPPRPSVAEEHALQLLNAVSGELVAHLERMSDEATEMLRAAEGCAGMPMSLVDDIVYRWSEALLRGGPSNWRAEYDKLKNGE